MRILVVSERFAPENTVAAIRMTKVSKYLHQVYGATIDVITRKKQACIEDLEWDLSFINKFYYIEEGPIPRKIIEYYKKYSSSDHYTEERRKEISEINASQKTSTISKIKILIRSLIAVGWSEYSASAYAIAAYRHIECNNYDCVISSFGPESSQYIGRYVKMKNPNIVWIADYRDPLYSGEATKGLLALWAKSFPNRVTKNADAITTVSNGFIRCLGIEDRDNVYVITNGYDKQDIEGIEVNTENTNKLNMVYVGSLLVGRRDIRPILKAIDELISEGKIDCNCIKLSYAGADWKEFNIQASEFDLNIEIVNYKKIQKREALQLELESDLLLMAAWNTKEYEGSLPLKLYEYMMVNKPIICTISGNKGASELKDIINECNIGFCYESVNGYEEFLKLKDYLYKLYISFIKGHSEELMLARNEKSIERYHYRELAGSFFDIINKHGIAKGEM